MLPHLLALLLLLAVPAWDIWEVRVLRRSTAPTARRNCYLRIVAVLWVLTGLALLIHPLSVYMAAPLSAADLFGGPAPKSLASPVLLMILLAAVLAPVLLSAVHAPTRARFMVMFDAFDFLLPPAWTFARWPLRGCAANRPGCASLPAERIGRRCPYVRERTEPCGLAR